MMPVNHDEVIRALCAKAAKADSASKMLESKRNAKGPPQRSVSTLACPETDLQKVFSALCAKATDVAIASKISEASDQFGKLSPALTVKSPTKVVASLCAKASSFQLYDADDDETATYQDEATVGSFSKQYDKEFDQISTTASTSSESETSADQHRLIGTREQQRATVTFHSPTPTYSEQLRSRRRASTNSKSGSPTESDHSGNRRRASTSSYPSSSDQLGYRRRGAAITSSNPTNPERSGKQGVPTTISSPNSEQKSNRRPSMSSQAHSGHSGVVRGVESPTNSEPIKNFRRSTNMHFEQLGTPRKTTGLSKKKAAIASFAPITSVSHLYDDDETATHHDETTVGSLPKVYVNDDFDLQSITFGSVAGSETSDQFRTLRRASTIAALPKGAVFTSTAASTLHHFGDDTTTHQDDATVGSLSKLCSELDQQINALCTINQVSDSASMTSEELNELAKSLVTTPSGGNDTYLRLDPQGPPPRVMLHPKASCDTSITSDLTDWDFGFAKSGTSSLSELDADKVVENFYKMAATDPVLARRIAMAASSVIAPSERITETKIPENSYQGTFPKLATVQEYEGSSEVDVANPTVVKPTRRVREPAPSDPTHTTRALMANPTTSRPLMAKSSRKLRSLPQPKQTKPSITALTSDKQRKSLSKVRAKAKSEDQTKHAVFEHGSPQPRRDPPGLMKIDNSPGFCFVQDNPKSHR